MYRNIGNLLPKILYMVCGALLCMIYNDIARDKDSSNLFLSNAGKEEKGACNCPGSLHGMMERQQRVFAAESKLSKEKSDIEGLVQNINGDFDQEKHAPEKTHYSNEKSEVDDTRLPTWAFNQKSIFRSFASGGDPKVRMDGEKDKTMKRLISSAFKKACIYAKQRKKIKVCDLWHGSLSIDIEKGIKMSFILSEENRTSLRVVGKFKLQDLFTIESGRTVKNQQGEIHVITMMSDSLPISRLTDFLAMIKSIHLKQKLFFYFSLYGKTQNVRQYEHLIIDASKNLKNARFKVLHVKGNFERGAARHNGVSMLPPKNVLILFVDIDISFNSGFLQRCQLYTESKQSVYFPIVFSQYNPKIVGQSKKPWVISSNHGMWRDQGHGNLCVFKSDYLEAGGFSLNITGWGSEDDEIYQR
eukprot:gene15046-6209_t